jgi:hypothetical protein
MVTAEVESPATIAQYRSLGHPSLFFLPLHALEVRNAILTRAFFQRRALASGDRRHVVRERDAALSRLDRLLARRVLLDVTADMEEVIAQAGKLSSAHSERLGARAIDLLHVAAALNLECELFLATDARQSRLAKAVGIDVIPITGS